jgi:hypothetical protein
VSAQRPKRARTVRREEARRAADLARDRERLFFLEPGGSADRPIDVASPSVVETRAALVPCPRCGGEHEVLEHVATTSTRGLRVREARLRCRRCASARSLFFALPQVN